MDFRRSHSKRRCCTFKSRQHVCEAVANRKDWSAASVDLAYQKGIVAWRAPDKDGASCASCHTPDAVDLAMIGFSDGTILRRAFEHLGPEQAGEIRDFVHAQRVKLTVANPCDPLEWRVFQPGGKPLAGDTLRAQEEGLIDILKVRNLGITRKLDTEQDLQKAWSELATLNVKRLPIGTRMPRWSEDSYNGVAHKSVNDWITSVPRNPVDQQWYQRADAYLQNPTDEAFWALVRDEETLTKPGYEKSVNFFDPWTKSNATLTAESSIGYLMRAKATSALIASHFFRMELQKKPGFYDMQPVPRPVADFKVDAWRTAGALYQEDHCYNSAEACQAAQFDWLPSSGKRDFDRDQFFKQAKTTVDPWWTLGFLFDPALLQNGTDTLHYWQGFDPSNNLPRREVHRPLLFGLVQVNRVEFLEKIRTGQTKLNVIFPQGPQQAGLISSLPVAPILDGRFIVEEALRATTPDGAESSPRDAVFISSNILRVLLQRMRVDLERGSNVFKKAPILEVIDNWGSSVETIAKSERPDIVADRSYYIDTVTLAARVSTLVKAAKEVAP
jgi:hypothetical protein